MGCEFPKCARPKEQGGEREQGRERGAEGRARGGEGEAGEDAELQAQVREQKEVC